MLKYIFKGGNFFQSSNDLYLPIPWHTVEIFIRSTVKNDWAHWSNT